MNSEPLISIIVPIFNGCSWIDQCFAGILQQEIPNNVKIEICVCNDGSTDDTFQILNHWSDIFQKNNFIFKVYHNTGNPGGVGFSKNKAVDISKGDYLCFQDIDDVMLSNRLIEQYEKATHLPKNTIIGSQFERVPKNSTTRYTKWANSLSNDQLYTQIYTSHGPTIIMPTWFCHRSVFDSVGGFSEEGNGVPEDLIFFYKHLDLGGNLYKVEKPLVIYTYHLNATTFSIKESTIWNLRLRKIEEDILNKWHQFTIWNAGKQGRKFYLSLSEKNKAKVVALCDVDEKKIGKKYIPFNPNSRQTGVPLNIIHFTKARPPFVICVKINMTNGEFEKNLESLKLTENIDYVWFS